MVLAENNRRQTKSDFAHTGGGGIPKEKFGLVVLAKRTGRNLKRGQPKAVQPNSSKGDLMSIKRTKVASIVSGSAAALLVAGLAVFGPGTANAADCVAYQACGAVSGTFAAGGAFNATITNLAPGESVTLYVTVTNGSNPGISVAGASSLTTTANDAGQASFRITVPRNASGTLTWVALNSAGQEVLRGSAEIGGRVSHPAAG